MVFFFSEAAIEKKIRCQLISSHFIGPPLFFVDVKRCENVERLPQTTFRHGEATCQLSGLHIDICMVYMEYRDTLENDAHHTASSLLSTGEP